MNSLNTTTYATACDWTVTTERRCCIASAAICETRLWRICRTGAWQSELAELLAGEATKRTIATCCRQSGMSFTANVFSAHRAVYHRNSLVLLVAMTPRQSPVVGDTAFSLIWQLPHVRLLQESRTSVSVRVAAGLCPCWAAYCRASAATDRCRQQPRGR
jgi:hypothetical protein